MARKKPNYESPLARLLDKHGIKYEVLALTAEIPITSLHGYLAGKHEPRVTTLWKIEQFLRGRKIKHDLHELFPAKPVS